MVELGNEKWCWGSGLLNSLLVACLGVVDLLRPGRWEQVVVCIGVGRKCWSWCFVGCVGRIDWSWCFVGCVGWCLQRAGQLFGWRYRSLDWVVVRLGHRLPIVSLVL